VCIFLRCDLGYRGYLGWRGGICRELSVAETRVHCKAYLSAVYVCPGNEGGSGEEKANLCKFELWAEGNLRDGFMPEVANALESYSL
jgi:hypothetical protein